MTTSTALTKRARIRLSEEARRELVVCFEQIGQTCEQFCADQGFALSTFSWNGEPKDSVDHDTGKTFKITPKMGFSKTTEQRLTMPISENGLV